MVFENLKKLSFLIVQSVLVVVNASYYQKEFSGYLFTTSSYYGSEWRNQSDAQNWCIQNGSKLLAITNSSIQSAVVAFINDAIRQNQLTGNIIISDGKRTTDNWRWINGTSTTLSIGGQDSNTGYTLSHVYLNTASNGFTLWAALPTDTNYYICEFAGQASCVNGYQYGSQCFQSFSEAVTWFEARNRCLMSGGDLATFEFITTNDGLNSLSGSWINPSTQYWIGLRRQWWTWQSINSDVTYTQWSDGHPAYDVYQQCLCLLPNNPTYDWKWSECSCSSTYQFVCIRASTVSTVTTTRSTTTARTLSSSSQSSSTLNNPTPSSSSSTIALQATTNTPSSTSSKAVTTIGQPLLPITSTTLSSSSQSSASISNLIPQSSSSTIAIQNGTNVISSSSDKGANDKLAIGLGVGIGGGVLLIIILIIVLILLSRKGCISDRKESHLNQEDYYWEIIYKSGCLLCGCCCCCRKPNGQITQSQAQSEVTSVSSFDYESIQYGPTGRDINNSAPTYQELNINRPNRSVIL